MSDNTYTINNYQEKSRSHSFYSPPNFPILYEYIERALRMPLNQTSPDHTQHHTMTMDVYPLPAGVHAIPHDLLDLRPDAEIDQVLLNPKLVACEKNIWFFWHNGFTHMHPYTKRNIRAWHRRFSKSGWIIRVLDRVPTSPLNVAKFLDITDENTFPRTFVHGTIRGDYAPQHTSDW
ncbi:hypothetical protein ACMFMF_003706 [Clarireedia jacksonii]